MLAAPEPASVSAFLIIITAIVTVDGTGITITTIAAAGKASRNRWKDVRHTAAIQHRLLHHP
jgi:hypothetical protein